ncbi:hypothetical protein BGX21_011089 [Mortierella sp. AD011]|nr:hypothetical protein BGX20_008791 [Mortierella sp. AD010]KAF9402149.1 hypothetical protein BGX21_011089 [Mortierella sp. AD011]
MDVSNLAEHGLHPRYLHLLVNFPVLFVNLGVIGVTTMLQKLKAKQLRSDSKLITGLLHVEDGMTYNTHVIFYKTYMPPHHLFGYNPNAAQSHGVTLTISDWREKTRAELLQDITVSTTNHTLKVNKDLLRSAHEKSGQQAVLFQEIEPARFERIILIAPATVDFSNEDFYETRDSFSCHANFDHMDIILKRPITSLFMNVYYI